jgi:hypothetical protein
MAFASSIKPKTAPAGKPAKKKPGGRFSGIAPRGSNNEPLLKAGEYIVEFLESGLTRKQTCTWLDCFVVYSEGATADKPLTDEQIAAGETPPKLRFFINHGDIGNQTFVSLAMALCECTTVEDLEEGEPDYDELIDAICCKPSAQTFKKPGETEPSFGVNPIAGMRVYMRVWDSQTLANGGEPFRNAEFGVCPDEYKKAE